MKILYAIQGTGNGPISRARDIYPELCRHGAVDVLVSGIRTNIDVPFPVKHPLYGMSVVLGDKGNVSLWGTVRRLRPLRFLHDIGSLHIRSYDLVVNDFEPISAWAARLRNVPCIALSHQWAVMNALTPKPDIRDLKGRALLKHYAPCTEGYGFHFKPYTKKIFTPVIRREVRELPITDEGHYTVYLPAYDDRTLIGVLRRFGKVQWEVFSRECTEPAVYGNVRVQPVENRAFLKSMASCHGVLCSAGFECPAEALYLGKKLMVIPMEGQYEQQCNAAALASLNVPYIKKLSLKYYDSIIFWLSGAMAQVAVDYPNQTGMIIDTLVTDFVLSPERSRAVPEALSMPVGR